MLCKLKVLQAIIKANSWVLPLLSFWSYSFPAINLICSCFHFSSLNRSPPNLLKEIILVDDYSDNRKCELKVQCNDKVLVHGTKEWYKIVYNQSLMLKIILGVNLKMLSKSLQARLTLSTKRVFAFVKYKKKFEVLCLWG